MIKVDLIAVGTRPPGWIVEGIAEYTKRMKSQCRFQIIEQKTADRKKPQSIEGYQREEARAIESAIDDSARVIALDLSGKPWSTEQLAAKIESWSQMTNHLQFLIGGPDGLASSVLKQADEVWALSNLTFPHFLVRLLLAEQIYRALMVNANHPYHK